MTKEGVCLENDEWDMARYHLDMFKRWLGIFVFSMLVFSVFQPWGRFRDPDAFYHAKITQIMREQGIVKSFQWLDLTSLGKNFADHHFLFHVFTIPFQWVVELSSVRFSGSISDVEQSVLSILWAQQITGVFFGALFVMIWSLVAWRLFEDSWIQTEKKSAVLFLRWCFWPGLLLTCSPLLMRLSLAKASALALIWFTLGIGLFLKRESFKRVFWLWSFLIGAGFALSHGGWMILLGCQFLMCLGSIIFDRFVKDRSWREAFSFSLFGLWIMSVFGVVAGLILHPNFPQNVSFLWVQVVKIGVLTPSRVIMGGEWNALTPLEVLLSLLPIALVFLVMVFGFVFAIKKPLDQRKAQWLIQLFIPLAALFAWTFKSQRLFEYFVPVLVLSFMIASQLVDWKTCLDEILIAFRSKYVTSKRIVFVSGFIFLLIIGRQMVEVYRIMHAEGRAFSFFSGAMQYLNEHAQPNDRLFHVDWDQFPNVFVRGERFRFISGLDPTFLLESAPDLSDMHRDLMLGKVTSSVGEIVRDRFQAQYVIVDRKRPLREAFGQAVDKDPVLQKEYEDDEARVYRVK